MRVDLHIHTREWSDGKAGVADMLQAAVDAGLHGVAIADHERMLAPEDQAALARAFPSLRIFRAAEVSVPGRDHILLVGGDYRPLPLLPNGAQRPLDEVRDYARATGCFTVLNHPFWLAPELRIDLDAFCPEAMDVLSMNLDTARLETYASVAIARRMLLFASSDAHGPEHVGLFHVDVDAACRSDSDLVAALRAGRYRLATVARLWAAREAEIAAEEGPARDALRRGLAERDYVALGHGTTFFRRVAAGGSYQPRRELLGLAGRDWEALAALSRSVSGGTP